MDVQAELTAFKNVVGPNIAVSGGSRTYEISVNDIFLPTDDDAPEWIDKLIDDRVVPFNKVVNTYDLGIVESTETPSDNFLNIVLSGLALTDSTSIIVHLKGYTNTGAVDCRALVTFGEVFNCVFRESAATLGHSGELIGTDLIITLNLATSTLIHIEGTIESYSSAVSHNNTLSTSVNYTSIPNINASNTRDVSGVIEKIPYTSSSELEEIAFAPPFLYSSKSSKMFPTTSYLASEADNSWFNSLIYSQESTSNDWSSMVAEVSVLNTTKPIYINKDETSVNQLTSRSFTKGETLLLSPDGETYVESTVLDITGNPTSTKGVLIDSPGNVLLSYYSNYPSSSSRSSIYLDRGVFGKPVMFQPKGSLLSHIVTPDGEYLYLASIDPEFISSYSSEPYRHDVCISKYRLSIPNDLSGGLNLMSSETLPEVSTYFSKRIKSINITERHIYVTSANEVGSGQYMSLYRYTLNEYGNPMSVIHNSGIELTIDDTYYGTISSEHNLDAVLGFNILGFNDTGTMFLANVLIDRTYESSIYMTVSYKLSAPYDITTKTIDHTDYGGICGIDETGTQILIPKEYEVGPIAHLTAYTSGTLVVPWDISTIEYNKSFLPFNSIDKELTLEYLGDGYTDYSSGLPSADRVDTTVIWDKWLDFVPLFMPDANTLYLYDASGIFQTIPLLEACVGKGQTADISHYNLSSAPVSALQGGELSEYSILSSFNYLDEHSLEKEVIGISESSIVGNTITIEADRELPLVAANPGTGTVTVGAGYNKLAELDSVPTVDFSTYYFTEDGYHFGRIEYDAIYQYDLDTPFDLGSYNSNFTVDSPGTDYFINYANNGTLLLLSHKYSNTVEMYSLTTPYVSTSRVATPIGSIDVIGTTVSDYWLHGLAWDGCTKCIFTDSGSRMYIEVDYYYSRDLVYYTLTVPYDMSTATQVSVAYDYTSDAVFVGADFGFVAQDLYWKSPTELLLVTDFPFVYITELSTPWDVSTITFITRSELPDIGDVTNRIRGACFAENGNIVVASNSEYYNESVANKTLVVYEPSSEASLNKESVIESEQDIVSVIRPVEAPWIYSITFSEVPEGTNAIVIGTTFIPLEKDYITITADKYTTTYKPIIAKGARELQYRLEMDNNSDVYDVSIKCDTVDV